MLTFFRTYQKSVLIVVAVLVIVSCFFSSTSYLGDSRETEAEKVFIKAVDGSKIEKRRIDRIADFLSSGHPDLLDDKISSPNFLNDGVLEKDFLENSLGSLVAEKVFPSIQKDLSRAVESAKSFRPYRHPNNPALDASLIWSQFSPEIAGAAASLWKLGDTPTHEAFDVLSKLYLKQKAIPLVFFRRMMKYQESQDSRSAPDESLPNADLTLFGLHGAKQWFGSNYLEAVARVIANGAAEAAKRGIQVSTAEAREQLLTSLSEGARKTGEKIDPAALDQVFRLEAGRLGMSEKECIDAWKEIALFRKLLAHFRDSAALDPAVLQQEYEASKDLVTLDLFSLPVSLRFKDFPSLLKLQLYIEAVSNTPKDSLALPRDFLTPSEIRKKMPELVRTEYLLEYREIDLKKAALQVGVKETLAWQTTDSGWEILEASFPFIGKNRALTKEERFALLEELSAEQRLEADAFSREKILSSDKERIDAMLLVAPLKNESCLVGDKGEGLPFKEIKQTAPLLTLLEATSVKEQSSETEAEMTAKKKLSAYSPDGRRYYKIEVVERSAEPRVLTFAEADSLGVLRQKLDSKLEALYPIARKKGGAAYTNSDGSPKALSEVKDQVGLLLFPELISAIQAEYKNSSGAEPTYAEKQSPMFYVKHRMHAHLAEVLKSFQQNSVTQEDKHPLAAQWDLVSDRKTKNKKELRPEEFAVAEGDFSPLRQTSSGRELFFKTVSKFQKEKLSDDELEVLLEPFRKDAEKKGVLELLGKMEASGSLYLGQR